MWDNLHVYDKKQLISIDMVLIDEESFVAEFREKKCNEERYMSSRNLRCRPIKKGMRWLKKTLQCCISMVLVTQIH
ncbi:unnamed protein product [Trifolium pratense]|uniref:Uncharacterized protein n=1 Tax=Trifolium pratense TaxID=57577 RepID=A0ACB0IQ20_TRIPR|nr:unnamed protein product [Trifolium pratense]